MKTVRKDQVRTRREAVTRGTGNVFADLGFAPADAADLKVKAQLTLQIYQRIKALGLTQVKAAQQLEISQPDVSRLMSGRHSGYSIDRLLALLNALEVDIDIVVRPRHHGKMPRTGRLRVRDAAAA